MGTKGAIRGRHAQSFAQRARKADFQAIMKEEVAPLIKKNDVVADICAGSGQLIPYILRNAKRVTAVDASDDMINILSRRYGKDRRVKIIRADAARTSLPTESFDAITFTFSLHHIREGGEVLRESARLLRPNGRLVLVDMVFNGRWYHKIFEPLWRLRKAVKQGWHEIYCVYRDTRNIEKLIKESGFRIRRKKRMKRYRKGYRDRVYPTLLYELEKA